MVIDVYKFGQEIFTIGTFWYFLYKHLKTIQKIQNAQMKLYHDENFLQHAEIQSSYFAG